MADVAERFSEMADGTSLLFTVELEEEEGESLLEQALKKSGWRGT